MGESTNIPWCDATWNPIRGCDKVSVGCKNCYIVATPVFRFSGLKHGDPRVIAGEATWNEPFRWNKKPWVCDVCGVAVKDRTINTAHYPPKGEFPCKGISFHRRRIFSLSLGDWLDPKIPIEHLTRMLDIIYQCRELDFLLCTKRPELFPERFEAAIKSARPPVSFQGYEWMVAWAKGEPPKNVWVLASAENQEMLDKRLPELLRIPAVVHGLSCEPLLGPTDILSQYPWATGKFDMARGTYERLHWVIAGGESGPQARPMQVEWLRSIQQQCEVAGIPYFCKQFGANPRQDLSYAIPESDITDPNLEPADIAAWEAHRHSARLHLKDKKGGKMEEWPDAKMRVRQFPKVEGR